MQKRETTYNWIWTGIFSIVFAGSATDIYYNRDEIQLELEGKELNLDQKEWIIILSLLWFEVVICMLAIIFNEWFEEPWQLPCRDRRSTSTFGWRHLEGLIVLIQVGGKFYVILEYTGVDGVINGLSNAYFGVWGSFFNSVFTFGTWLRENKDTEWIARERRGGRPMETARSE